MRIFLDVLRHFFEKAEKELKKFQQKTGWNVELMAYLRKDDDVFVATRDVDGKLEIIPQEEFLDEEEDDDGYEAPPEQTPPHH